MNKSKKLTAAVAASAVASAMVAPAAFAATNLTDIDGSYAKDAIAALVEKGIINGKGDGKFDPTGKIERQDFAIILAKALGLKTDEAPATASFTDVPKDHYAFGYVEAAVKAGLIAGNGDGTFGAGNDLTRQDMAVLFARALKHATGYDVTGKASNLKFTDSADIADYAKDAVGAAVELGLIAGNPDNTFNPLGNAERQAVALVAHKFLNKAEELAGAGLTAAALTDSKTVALTFSKEVAELKKEDIAVAVKADNKAVAVADVTLSADKKSATVKLDAAVAAGTTYTVTYKGKTVEFTTAAQLGVASVTVNNLIEVVVKFDSAVDEDSLKTTNFELSDADVTVSDVDLSEDGTTATLTLSKALDNDTDYDLTVKSVTNTSGVAIEETTKTFTAQDVTLPELQSIEFVGPQTAKLTFSEPISSTSSDDASVSIDNGAYSATIDNTSYDGRVVTVDLGTELSEGKHDFKVTKFSDYAQYTMVGKTLSVEYKDVAEAPTVTVKKASQSSVTLTFNRPVKGLEAAAFYQTYSSWAPLEIQDANGNVIDPATDDIDKYYDEVKLVFTAAAKATPSKDTTNDRPLPVGSTKIVVLKEGDVAELKDRWGNVLANDVTLTAEINADTTAPTVSSVEVEAEDEVKVYFSEAVNADDAKSKDNIVIKDEKGEKLSSSSYSLVDYVNSGDDHVLTIKFIPALDAGKYTITLEAIKDLSLNKNPLATVTKEFSITDLTGVDLADLAVKKAATGVDNVIYVDFGEKMATTGQGSILNADNYLIQDKSVAGKQSALPDGTKVTAFGDTMVKITLPTSYYGAAGTVVGKKLTVGRVADAAGNQAQQLSQDFTIDNEQGATVTAIKKVAANKFELTVNKELKSVKADGITVTNGGVTKKVASISYVNDGDETVIKVTTHDDVKSLTGTANVESDYTFNIIADQLFTVTGAALGAQTYIADADTTEQGGDDQLFFDGVAPKVVVDAKENSEIYAYDKDNNGKVDHVLLHYSEDIKANSVSKFSYSISGYTVTSALTSSATDLAAAVGTPADGKNGEWVVLTVKEQTKFDDNDTNLNIAQAYDIEDLAGNVYKADTKEAYSALETSASLNAAAYAAAFKAVNDATTAADVKTAIEAPALGLTLTAYNDLTTAHKDAVAAAVLIAKGSAFASQTALSTAFNNAVTAEATKQAAEKADADAVAAAKAKVAVGYATGDSASSVTQNLTLATVVDGVAVAWTSNNQAVVADNGTVTADTVDTDVVLTAVLTKGTATDQVTFPVTVIAGP